MLYRERTIKSYFEQTDLFAFRKQIVDGFFDRIADRTHCNDKLFRIGSAVVVEELIITADLLVDLLHITFNDCGNSVVILVAGFSCLEEDVGVLSGTAENGMLGVESALSEFVDSLHVDHFGKILVIPDFNLLNFMAGSEAVKEMNEGDSAFDSCKMCNSAEIHNLLNVAGAKHCKAGLAASHNVTVVAENVQCMRSDTTCGYMDNTGKKFTGDLVHIGDHEEQTLGSGVSCGERTCCQRAVDCTGCAALGLHLDDLNGLSENIFLAFGSPFVGYFRHRGGRSDRINSGNFRKGIRYRSRSGVTVHRKLGSFDCHWTMIPPLFFYRNIVTLFFPDVKP